MEGITQTNIRVEYGEFIVFQHRDRFRESKVQTEYANLRGANELAYYLEEEKQERENEQTTRERCNGEAMDG